MGGKGASVVVVILVLIVMFGSASQPLAVSAIPSDVEEVFKRLYNRDREFRDAVDEIRQIVSGDGFTEDDWVRFKELFNLVLSKAGLPTLDVLNGEQLSEFRREIEREARNIRLVRQWSARASAVTPTMTDEQEIELARQYVPFLLQPNWDIASPASNGLKSVYTDVHDESVYGYSLSGYYAVEVTLVFYDEDHPWGGWWDTFYDWLRVINWGRIEDLETFFIVVSKSSGSTERVSFLGCWLLRYDEYSQATYEVIVSGCYSRDQTWESSSHYEAKVTSFYGGQHPMLWVNTWNHMIGENDNNPPLENDHPYYLWNEPLTHGNREAAENVESSMIYLNEGLFESP